jgi:hypothetical protein
VGAVSLKKKVDDIYGEIFGNIAVDAMLRIKGITFPKGNRRKTVEFYRDAIGKDRKLLNDFNSAYNVLHLSGYYDGETSIKVIQSGFETAHEIIDRIKPKEAL